MKIKGMFKRSVAGLLLGVTLFTGYSATYLQAREVKAAAEVSGLYYCLQALMEYMMSLNGLSTTNRRDNDALCDAFCDWMDACGDALTYTKEEKVRDEFALLTSFTIGTKFALSTVTNTKAAMQEFIDKFVKQSKGNRSAYSKSVSWIDTPVENTAGYKGNQVGGGILSAYGYINGGSYTGSSGSSYAYYYTKNKSFSYNSTPYSGDVFVIYNGQYKYDVYPDSTSYYLDSYMNVRRFGYTGVIQRSKIYIYVYDPETKKNKAMLTVGTQEDLPTSLQKITKSKGYIMPTPNGDDPNKNNLIVSSIATLMATMEAIQLYGNSTVLPSQADQITDLVAGQTTMIDNINNTLQSLEDASLSEEEINQIIADNIIDYSPALDDINEGLDDVNKNTETTNKWLSKVNGNLVVTNNWLNQIYKKMDSISGNNALDIEDLTDQFKVVQGGASSSSPDEPPKIWGMGAFTTVKFLQPLFNFFGEPLSQITKWLSSIRGTITQSISDSTSKQVKAQEDSTAAINSVFSNLTNIPTKIFDAFKTMLQSMLTGIQSIVGVTGDILGAIKLLPKQIVEAINESLAITIPMEFPDTLPDLELAPVSLPSIEEALDSILAAVKGIFELDLDPINDEIADNVEKMDDKFPVSKFRMVLDEFNFDDTYDYPVIKIQCPQILVSYLGESKNMQDGYLILFNGKDYADTFKFVRALLTALIWVTYAYACLCKFKVRFVLD